MRQTIPATLLQRSGELHTKRHNYRKTPSSSSRHSPSPPLRPIFLSESPVLCGTLFLKKICTSDKPRQQDPRKRACYQHIPPPPCSLFYHAILEYDVHPKTILPKCLIIADHSSGLRAVLEFPARILQGSFCNPVIQVQGSEPSNQKRQGCIWLFNLESLSHNILPDPVNSLRCGSP